MNSNEQPSKFKKDNDFQFCVDSSLNKNKSLCDNDLDFLNQINPPQVKEIRLVSQRFTELILVQMRSSQWLNLTKLNLSNSSINKADNKIRTIGCKYLTQITMPSIANIFLSDNQISSHGVSHLIKGNWPLLSSLQIEFDCLHSTIISTVTKGNWPRLKELDVRQINKNEISLWAYWELMTIHNAGSIRNIKIGNQQLVVTNFFKRLLAKGKNQPDSNVVAKLKKKFVNLPPAYDI